MDFITPIQSYYRACNIAFGLPTGGSSKWAFDGRWGTDKKTGETIYFEQMVNTPTGCDDLPLSEWGLTYIIKGVETLMNRFALHGNVHYAVIPYATTANVYNDDEWDFTVPLHPYNEMEVIKETINKLDVFGSNNLGDFYRRAYTLQNSSNNFPTYIINFLTGYPTLCSLNEFWDDEYTPETIISYQSHASNIENTEQTRLMGSYDKKTGKFNWDEFYTLMNSYPDILKNRIKSNNVEGSTAILAEGVIDEYSLEYSLKMAGQLNQSAKSKIIHIYNSRIMPTWYINNLKEAFGDKGWWYGINRNEAMPDIINQVAYDILKDLKIKESDLMRIFEYNLLWV